jgi:hypothetical protein
MNVRKNLEQAAAALIYGMALMIVSAGVFLMCLPASGVGA